MSSSLYSSCLCFGSIEESRNSQGDKSKYIPLVQSIRFKGQNRNPNSFLSDYSSSDDTRNTFIDFIVRIRYRGKS